MNTSNTFLIVSECFYSIQGEGPSVGVPAVFLRLAGCNLRCRGFSYQDPVTGEHLGCDTAKVWREGKKTPFETLIEGWRQTGYLENLASGAHLVITGGEPLIQQAALIQFIELLDAVLPGPPFIEIETNATRLFSDPLLARLNQINASPKLTHSAEPREKAYQPNVLVQLVGSRQANFKFVVAHPADIHEIIRDYVQPFNILSQRIWLMPEGGTASALQQRRPMVAELCKRYLMHYSPRLHISIWGEVTGV